jgi:small subunit ribosomal protein S17
MAKIETRKEEKKENNKDIVVGTRGRTFKGIVTKKFDTRVVVEFERTVRFRKYERFAKKKTKLHARIPKDMTLHIDDIVKVRECRPLSKIIHFVVIDVVKGKELKK